MLERSLGSVRGDLIKWARMAQDLTMRSVKDRGGPCLGYQSEVENAKKAEVRSEVLAGWIRALNVTEAFVRGNIPRYLESPAACRGLAADIGGRVLTEGDERWSLFSPIERVREVLAMVSQRSEKLPRVVLAYILGLEITSLDATITGGQPVLHDLMVAVADLTILPQSFFSHGRIDLGLPSQAGTLSHYRDWGVADLSEYLFAVRLAKRLSLSPEALERLILSADRTVLDLVGLRSIGWPPIQ